MQLRSRRGALASTSLGLLLLVAAFAAAGPSCSPDVDGTFSGGQGGGGGTGGEAGEGGVIELTTSSSSSSGATSTSSATTSSTSSSSDPCGDGFCAPNETESCPEDCPTPSCAHPVCATGEALDPACDRCVAQVCGQDPFCCDMEWDGQCVGEAESICGVDCCGDGQCSDDETCGSCPEDCGACPAAPDCPHSVCVSGGALDGADCHDPCVAEVCAASPDCCSGNPPGWDAACEDEAEVLCGPDPCVTEVCQVDPTCCTVAWTPTCVTLATLTCGTQCNCAHSICSQGASLIGSCDPCVSAICELDLFCCESEWDNICVGWVGEVCAIDC